MKSQLFILFSILITVFFGCSKQQKVLNKLEGNWKIVSYKQTYSNGLSSPFILNGNFNFKKYNPKKTKRGTFLYSYTFEDTSLNNNVYINNGDYFTDKKSDVIYLQYTNPIDSSLVIRNLNILIITKTDLEFTTVYDQILHTFVLKKE
jgi:hypothetical protein